MAKNNSNNTTIRIGTRDSELALWQAHTVEKQLNDLGYKTEIIAVKSQGDIILDKPLYELGITGIFTKTLDVAMISGQVDIAVHSMKDVPTALPQGIVQAAVLERANTVDILVHKGNLEFLEKGGTIATGSLRRQAQWLNKYPNHTVVDLRGNVNTRMQKLQDNDWNGAVFAAAGLERINLKPETYIDLDWMIPAPAQGAMMVVAMENDEYALDALSQLNHIETEICTYIERQFLRTLEGGCTAPIGSLARYNENDDTIQFQGVLFSIDGQQKIEIDRTFDISEWKKLGFNCAKEILDNGGTELMASIKQSLKKVIMARQDIRILSTKSLLSNQKQFLLNADFLVVEADFIQTETIDFDLKKVNDALIFYKPKCCKGSLEHPEAEKIKSKTVFCVGIKTKALLEDNGFKVEAYAGYAEDLAQIIALVYSDSQYTFFSGNLRRDTLPDILTEAGIALNEIQVYETVLTPKKIDSKADGILFFSPSAVESYTQKNKIDKETAFCIGETTASAAADLGYKNIVIANQPTVENTIIQAINYFNPKH